MIVPVTAIPKANASAIELSKVNTSASTATISSQLICGT